jgi:hypothetical protein
MAAFLRRLSKVGAESRAHHAFEPAEDALKVPSFPVAFLHKVLPCHFDSVFSTGQPVFAMDGGFDECSRCPPLPVFDVDLMDFVARTSVQDLRLLGMAVSGLFSSNSCAWHLSLSSTIENTLPRGRRLPHTMSSENLSHFLHFRLERLKK